MTTKDEILIPKEKIQEGFKISHNQIVILLHDSQKLYEEKRYVSSISLSILARGELAKLDVLRLHATSNTGITKDEWTKLTRGGSHQDKLTKSYTDAQEQVSQLDEQTYNRIIEIEKKQGSKLKYRTHYSKIIKYSDTIEKRLKKFNEIKKAAFYISWKNNDWLTLATLYEENDLHVLANYLLQLGLYEINNQMLNYKYPSTFYHQVSPEVNIMMRDKLWRNCQKFYEFIYSDEFEPVILRVMQILDTFPNKLK